MTRRVVQVFVDDKSRPGPRSLAPARVEGNLGEFWSMLSKRVECEQCGATANAPCISQSEAKPGVELDGYHRARFLLAKQKFGRKN